ncbi:hypothetical protein PS874_03068 [Pseudomonas fluorescens]|jgi:hypothetical protein|nr:hypothetical protein PS874_03068 [Pseudomonas fluorescens]
MRFSRMFNLVFRWHGDFASDKESVVFTDQLEKVLEVPYGQGNDHAEAMRLFETGEQPGEVLLILYNSAAQSRKHGDTDVEGDLFILN